MRPDSDGRFHCLRTVKGRQEALSTWRVTTGSPDTAATIARLLGGEAREAHPSAREPWEIMTRTDGLRAVVEKASGSDLMFRLAVDCSAGVFHYSSGPWLLSEIMGKTVDLLAGQGGPALCDLLIRAVDFTTRTGTMVRYLLPSLVLIGRWDGGIPPE